VKAEPVTREAHEQWVREKVIEGWIWGPFEDPIYLEHPRIVPFDRLPPELRAESPKRETLSLKR